MPINYNQRTKFNWLQVLIIIMLVISIVFRLINLDRKVYWGDETITSLRIAGHTQKELVQKFLTGQVISNEDLQKYQQPIPQKGLEYTIKSLALEDSQHPPLYFLLTKLWVQWFTNSVATTRSLSALISLFALPCIYWLCLELFESPLVGWVAMALIAVSPFHLLYAQEAREYSLWTVTTLLSSASLLKALRLKTKISWIIYAVTIILGLYSYLLFVLVMIGHGIYVLLRDRFSWRNQTFISYLLATVAGLIAFLPWIWVIISGLSQVHKTAGWTIADKITFPALVEAYGINLSRIFIDCLNISAYFPELDLSNSLQIGRFIVIPLSLIVIPSVLILTGYAIYFLCRHASRIAWLFILTLSGTTGLALIIPDLIWGGQLSSVPRYLIPCYLGIQLAVAYLLATKMRFSSRFWQIQIWKSVTIVVLSSGILSCVVISQAESWWNKYGDYPNAAIARFINQTTQPLAISSSNEVDIGRILSLSYLLEPKVQLQLVVDPNIPQIPNGLSNVFLFNPTLSLQNGLEKDYRLNRVEELGKFQNKLWRLVKK